MPRHVDRNRAGTAQGSQTTAAKLFAKRHGDDQLRNNGPVVSGFDKISEVWRTPSMGKLIRRCHPKSVDVKEKGKVCDVTEDHQEEQWESSRTTRAFPMK